MGRRAGRRRRERRGVPGVGAVARESPAARPGGAGVGRGAPIHRGATPHARRRCSSGPGSSRRCSCCSSCGRRGSRRASALLAQEGGRYEWIGTLGNPGDVAVFLVLPALLAADRALSTHRRRLPLRRRSPCHGRSHPRHAHLTAVLAVAAGALVLRVEARCGDAPAVRWLAAVLAVVVSPVCRHAPRPARAGRVDERRAAGACCGWAAAERQATLRPPRCWPHGRRPASVSACSRPTPSASRARTPSPSAGGSSAS